MQMVKNILIIFLLLPIIIILLMPKKELYYLLENKLKKKNVIISEETLQEGLFSLTIKNPTVYFDGVPIAKAKEINIWSLLLYTELSAEKLIVAEGLPAEFSIKTIEAKHSIISPALVPLAGVVNTGHIEGKINLLDRTVNILFPKDIKTNALTKYLNKDEKGWIYESKF